VIHKNSIDGKAFYTVNELKKDKYFRGLYIENETGFSISERQTIKEYQ